MKILCVSYAYLPNIGGIERITSNLVDAWRKMGHEVKVITDTPSDESDPDIYRTPTKAQVKELKSWSDVCFMSNVSLKYISPFLFSGRLVLAAHKVPVADRPGMPLVLEGLKRWLYRRMPTIAVSSAVNVGLGGRCTVIANCYDQSQFYFENRWADRSPTAVFVGRLVSEKGAEVALRAVARALENGNAFRLSVVGSGPEESKLKELSRELGIEDWVTFTGPLSGAALRNEINRHRALIVPSTYEEPFGIVCLEGLACGCIVIGSAIGGIPEAIGPCGILVETGNAGALAERIQWAVCQESNPFAKATDAHLKQHTIEHVAARYIEIISKVARK